MSKKQSFGLSLAKKSSKTDCQVVLVNDKKQPILAESELATSVEKLIKDSHFSGGVGEVVVDYPQGLLLVGVGKDSEMSGTTIKKIANAIYHNLKSWSKTATVYVGDLFSDIQFGQLSLALLNNSYTFDKYKSKKADKPVLTEIYLAVEKDKERDLEDILAFQSVIFAGQSLTRDVVNEPPNVCFPAFMAEQAKQLAKTYPDLLTVKVVGEKEMAKLGMNCFLAVSQGSEKEGQLVILEYNGLNANKKAKKANLKKPIVLVGKGVTFDTGGISLKPAANMHEMKSDMGGAGATLGIMKALCEARLPLQVVGALACAENMPSGNATRPGDIVTAMNGKTVEILNTDAEGRLVLCDTLVYVQRYEPSVIIDMATLTGACVVALGHIRSGMFSNNEDVIFDLEQASDDAYDRIWHMPLDDDYQEQIDSGVADIQNIGNAGAGSVTAACFLARFVDDIPWAHLDIAGTAWQSGKDACSTGRPVPLIMHYLQRQSLQD